MCLWLFINDKTMEPRLERYICHLICLISTCGRSIQRSQRSWAPWQRGKHCTAGQASCCRAVLTTGIQERWLTICCSRLRRLLSSSIEHIWLISSWATSSSLCIILMSLVSWNQWWIQGSADLPGRPPSLRLEAQNVSNMCAKIGDTVAVGCQVRKIVRHLERGPGATLLFQYTGSATNSLLLLFAACCIFDCVDVCIVITYNYSMRQQF